MVGGSGEGVTKAERREDERWDFMIADTNCYFRRGKSSRAAIFGGEREGSAHMRDRQNRDRQSAGPAGQRLQLQHCRQPDGHFWQ